MTTVNPQIVDAVTDANVKVVGEAPAIALGNLFQSLSHATSRLFENSVVAQQQQNTLAIAAMSQGITQIYALDTAAAAATFGELMQSDVQGNMMSLAEALHAANGGAAPAGQPGGSAAASPNTPGATANTASVPSASTVAADITPVPPVSDPGSQSDVISQIERSVTFVNQSVMENAPGFTAAVQESIEIMQAGIDAMNRVTHDRCRRMLCDAAIAVTMAAMIREPEKAKAYDEVLRAIAQLS